MAKRRYVVNIFQRHRITLLIGAVILCAILVSEGVIFAEGTIRRLFPTTVAVSATPTYPVPTTQPHEQRAGFQYGIVYPQWENSGYSNSDQEWQQGLGDMQKRTGAGWVEMTVEFGQSTLTSTTFMAFSRTASVQSVTDGIRFAHRMGYHVFLAPLITVLTGSQPWVGAVQFATDAQEEEWFANYWQIFEPYVRAAAQNNVEQLALGTEIEWLQQNASAALWNQLIANIRGIYHGLLTYDINWTALSKPVPAWFQNASIDYIGVSEYIPLFQTPTYTVPSDLPDLWESQIGQVLDSFATEVGQPLLLSEVGYRNSTDALYNPWVQYGSMPPDPQLQADAFSATLTNVIPDPHIVGMFAWGWNNVGLLAIQGLPATYIIHSWYGNSS